jgi:hypothetical protein
MSVDSAKLPADVVEKLLNSMQAIPADELDPLRRRRLQPVEFPRGDDFDPSIFTR